MRRPRLSDRIRSPEKVWRLWMGIESLPRILPRFGIIRSWLTLELRPLPSLEDVCTWTLALYSSSSGPDCEDEILEDGGVLLLPLMQRWELGLLEVLEFLFAPKRSE